MSVHKSVIDAKLKPNKTRKLPLPLSDEALQDIKDSFSEASDEFYKQIMKEKTQKFPDCWVIKARKDNPGIRGYIPEKRTYYKDTDFPFMINKQTHSILVSPWGSFTIRTGHSPKNKNKIVYYAWITKAPIKYKHIIPSYVCEAGDRDNILNKLVKLIKE